MTAKQSKAEKAAFIKICELIGEMSLGIHGREESDVFKRIDEVLRKSIDYKPYTNVQKQLSEHRIALQFYANMLNELYESKDDLKRYGELIHKISEDKGETAYKLINRNY